MVELRNCKRDDWSENRKTTNRRAYTLEIEMVFMNRPLEDGRRKQLSSSDDDAFVNELLAGVLD